MQKPDYQFWVNNAYVQDVQALNFKMTCPIYACGGIFPPKKFNFSNHFTLQEKRREEAKQKEMGSREHMVSLVLNINGKGPITFLGRRRTFFSRMGGGAMHI